jgi:hypothetical protein
MYAQTISKFDMNLEFSHLAQAAYNQALHIPYSHGKLHTANNIITILQLNQMH